MAMHSLLWRAGVLLAFAVCLSACSGRADFLSLKKDRREFAVVNRFGFNVGGHIDMSIRNIEFFNKEGAQIFPNETQGIQFNVGLAMFGAKDKLPASYFRSPGRQQSREKFCALKHAQKEKKLMIGKQPPDNNTNMNNTQNTDKNGLSFTWEIEAGAEGAYTIYFQNCDQRVHAVSLELKMNLYNVEKGVKNYLSAGNIPIISVDQWLAFAFLIAAIAWSVLLQKRRARVMFIHRLMQAVIFTKVISLVVKSLSLSHVAVAGETGFWNNLYWVVHGLNVVMIFLSIFLIGTGWSILKPFLSTRDKKVLMTVIPLQVIANIALTIYQNEPMGSPFFAAWKDVFVLVDLICCFAVMVPIVWSIRHLQLEKDDASQRTLKKLKLFRGFYLLVMVYVYSSRVLYYVLLPSVAYDSQWIAEVLREGVTLSFFVITGTSLCGCVAVQSLNWFLSNIASSNSKRFAPMDSNPYLRVHSDLEDESVPDVDGAEEADGSERAVEMRNRAPEGTEV